MKLFRSKKNNESDSATATVEVPDTEAGRLEAAGDFLAAAELLQEENRGERSAERERHMVRLRHRAGIKLTTEANDVPPQPEPDPSKLALVGDVPEIDMKEATPELARAAILTHGCLLVRNVLPVDEALEMQNEIERSFQSRDVEDNDGYHELFEPDPPYNILERGWVTDAGGVWAADSPRVMFDMIEAFDRAGLQNLVEGYLGERPAFSVNKCTLRKVTPEAGTAWHQDGAFLGDVKALNVWLALSHCGDTAPGMDIVPKRIESILPTGTDDALFDWSISDKVAEEAAAETPIVRPIFEPGDVLLFDDLFLHRTAAEKTMPNNRYAIESWFFGPSTFPEEYVPLAF